jgi:hypothetical protein
MNTYIARRPYMHTTLVAVVAPNAKVARNVIERELGYCSDMRLVRVTGKKPRIIAREIRSY